MKKGGGNREIWKAFSLLTQLGLSMAACVMIGVFAGRWLDGKLGTTPWLLIVGSLVGAASSFKVLYDTVIKEWIE